MYLGWAFLKTEEFLYRITLCYCAVMLVSAVGRTIGWLAAGLVGLMFKFNGIVMLVSPKAWFRLPHGSQVAPR
jgi:hypothetical protein